MPLFAHINAVQRHVDNFCHLTINITQLASFSHVILSCRRAGKSEFHNHNYMIICAANCIIQGGAIKSKPFLKHHKIVLKTVNKVRLLN